MKTAFLGILIVLASSIAVAHGETHSELPEPGTTPDSLLYSLDTALDRVNLALTFNKKTKAEKRLEIANERLSEAKTMANKNNTRAASVALQNFHGQMSVAKKAVTSMEGEKSETLSKKINDTYGNNDKVLRALVEMVPGEASQGIKKALKASGKMGMRQVSVGGPSGEGGFIASGTISSR